ncbi:MAG: hypothetical protein RIR11_5143 [Bacteroidota bacterium]|jgi:hypothetical protein
MKKTILSVLLLVQLFQNGISQPSFQIILSVKDSSKSFFSHDKVDISVPLRTIDAEENEQPSINACYNLSVIQVKFPFTDWMFWDSSGTRYVWTENPCQLRVDPIRFDCYINLLPLYNQKPEFLNAMKDGGILEARFKMYASVDGGPYDYIYSNIDTLYLPPANKADLDGLVYITNNIENWRKFSYIEGSSWRDYTNGFLANIADLFGDSIIGDLANYQLEQIETTDNTLSNTSTSVEIREYLDLKYGDILVNSKSEMLKDYIVKIIDLYK